MAEQEREPRQESAYRDPRYVRDKFAEVWNAISGLLESQRLQGVRIEQHEDLIRTLTTVVKGNAEIQHGGVLSQVADISKTVSEIKKTQEMSERERELAKLKWRWVGLGIGLAALPGVRVIYEAVKTLIVTGP